jgi:hypothetical protein
MSADSTSSFYHRDSAELPCKNWFDEEPSTAERALEEEDPDELDPFTEDDLLPQPEFDETFQDIVEMDAYPDSDLGHCF